MDNIFKTILRYMDTAPVDIQGLIKELGIEIKWSKLLDYDGHIEKSGDGYKIYVNTNLSYNNQTFVMARELACYVLRRNLIDNDGFRTKADEIEFNRLAASLLMPKKLVYRFNEKHNGDVSKIANELDVPESAVNIAMKYII